MAKFKFRRHDVFHKAQAEKIARTPAKGEEASYFLKMEDNDAPVTLPRGRGYSPASEALRKKEN